MREFALGTQSVGGEDDLEAHEEVGRKSKAPSAQRDQHGPGLILCIAIAIVQSHRRAWHACV